MALPGVGPREDLIAILTTQRLPRPRLAISDFWTSAQQTIDD